MIAYHFPPFQGSTGLLRTLGFARYLRDFDWKPVVLTADPMAYPSKLASGNAAIPDDIVVRRTFGLDAARHFSVFGRYPNWLAVPDRWGSWWFSSVLAGLQLIRQHRPKVIWSTYPIATSHLIALTLHRLSGIPWVADFRDPMVGQDHPALRGQRAAHKWIERRAVRACQFAVFTTPGAALEYRRRYPDVLENKWMVIPNGYEEESFAIAAGLKVERRESTAVHIVHSGLIDSDYRDPTAMFRAIGNLKRAGKVDSARLRLTLRASGNEAHYAAILEELDIQDIVQLAPSVPYVEALSEMLNADGLLLLQGSSCNLQIPAKVYEYLRARRPILALTDAEGDTGKLLSELGIDTMAPLDSDEAIANELQRFLEFIEIGRAPVASDEQIHLQSRRARTQVFAELLNRAVRSVT